MRAAIEAGIGIGCRTRLFAAGRLSVLFDHRLPELPQVAYALWSGRRLGPAATSLAAIVEEAVASLPV
jgi:DNA-binding transcriptional LysR family regulator